MTRALRMVLASITLLVLVTVVALVVVNGTYFGRERVRTMALDAVRGMVNGEIMVGRIDGNLLDQFVLVDVSITDEHGRPFLTADSIRARVAIAPLIQKRIVITSIELHQPVVRLSRTPGGDWNYRTIFESNDTLPVALNPGFGSWVDLHGITIRNGTLLVQQPFPSDEPLKTTVGDSAVAALARDTRLRVERDGSGNGLRQTMEFRDINARIPRFVAADPDSAAVALRVRELSMIAAVFQSPDVVVRDFSGNVRYIDDTVALRDVELQLPQSHIEGDLTYHVSAGDVDVDLTSDTLAFADVRVLYPPLPERGGGRLELKASIRDTGTSRYEVRNARLAVDQSRVEGQFGMSLNSHVISFDDTDLEFRRLTTSLVERLAPAVDMRVPGSYTGRARLNGPANAIRTDVKGTFDPERHAPFDFTIRGVVGTGQSVIARDLRVTARRVPVSLAREFAADIPLGGTVSVDAVASGSTSAQLTGRVTVRHRDSGHESTILAQGSVAPDDSMRMQLDVDLMPVSLEVAQRFAPSVDFQGAVTGKGKVSGTPGSLKTTFALQLPAGTMDVDGTFDVASEVQRYQATVQVRNVDAHAMVPTMPVTSLNGVATVDGRGTDPKTMNARLTMHMLDAMVDSTRVIEAVAVASARDGRLAVDTMRVRTPFATATAQGTFGLAEGTEGTLAWSVDVPELSGLQRWIGTGDTSAVPVRPLVRQRMAAQVARGDSLRRLADSANIGAMATRRDGQRRPTTAPRELQASDALARDSIAGTMTARGTLKGGVSKFTAEGKAAINQLVWGGNEIGKGSVDFTWADVRTPDAVLTAEAGVDSVRAAGFAFDSTHAKATYRGGSGDLTLAVFPGDTAVYRFRAVYALRTNDGEVRLQDVNLRFDSTAWVSTRESTIGWREGGLRIDSLELRSRDGKGGGRIFVNGEVPDRDPGRLEVRIDSLRVAPWLTLLQATVPLDGIATVNAQVEGTRSSPQMRGTVALERSTYRKTPFPEFHSEVRYANRELRFDGGLRRIGGGGAQIATLRGQLPIDLSFGDSVTKRTLDGPISIDLEGDSIPLGPLVDFVDAFSAVSGEAAGKIAVRGSWTEPRIEGAVAVNMPRLGLRDPGITLTNSIARVHMDGDRLVIDTLIAHSGGGFARVTGSIKLEEFARPIVDVRLLATEARVLDNAKGQLVMSSNMALKGPIDTLDVSGSLTVIHGVIRIPDPEEWRLINTGDPVVFSVVDTSLARQLEVAPPSPILRNANVDVRLDVKRGTWARSREANIEVFGDLAIERARGDDEMTVTGALSSDYGDYELYGRRFRIERGSVRFTGPSSNPVLQLVANHEVRQAGRAPFDIQVTIGGTLEHPNISLESKAQPTLTQSDLISFLAFGQSSTSLLQFEGSGLEGGGQSGSSMAGNVATLATRQLAGVALGALFAELESDLTEKTAADVLNIRPADLPPGLSLGAVRSVAMGTQIEYGKYLDRNTFFVGTFRPTFTLPGATLERRFGSQLKSRLSFEPRYLPQVPSLTSGLQPKLQQVFGALLFWTRSW